jgi:23S rRNA pseudouridine2605 synthase
MEQIKPVGRLDWRAEGLILVTNNHTLAAALESKNFSIEREFKVRIWGKLEEKDLEKLRNGFVKSGKKFPGIVIWKIKGGNSSSWYGVKLYHGKNQIIKRMLYACKVSVDRIKQISYGKYRLEDLKPHEFREVPIGLDVHEAMFLHYKSLLLRE